jgi:hypothetical protein
MLPADQAAQRDLAAAQEAEEQEQNRFFAGQRSLGFGPPAKLLVDSLQRIGGAQRLPLRNPACAALDCGQRCGWSSA